MSIYFLDLHEGERVLLDSEGIDAASPSIALAHAIKSARSIMGADIQDGVLSLNSCIAIRDSDGHDVAKVRFRDALEIAGI